MLNSDKSEGFDSFSIIFWLLAVKFVLMCLFERVIVSIAQHKQI